MLEVNTMLARKTIDDQKEYALTLNLSLTHCITDKKNKIY